MAANLAVPDGGVCRMVVVHGKPHDGSSASKRDYDKVETAEKRDLFAEEPLSKSMHPMSQIIGRISPFLRRKHVRRREAFLSPPLTIFCGCTSDSEGWLQSACN